MSKNTIRVTVVTLLLVLLTGFNLSSAQPRSGSALKGPLFLKIETTKGEISCELDAERSMEGVEHIKSLSAAGKYMGATFCRMVPSFFVQGGCSAKAPPTGSKNIKLDPIGRHDKAGVLSLAPDANGFFGQQFIILERPAPWLDGSYVVIGQCGPLKTIKTMARVPTLAKALARRPIPIIKMRIGLESELKPVNGLAK
jgi:cyclophilin family peptidyl-prolyl cis-trans isomerase